MEGFNVEILNNNGEIKIIIDYKKIDENKEIIFEFKDEITEELLDEIIKENIKKQ